jgi:hypothetical protein
MKTAKNPIRRCILLVALLPVAIALLLAGIAQSGNALASNWSQMHATSVQGPPVSAPVQATNGSPTHGKDAPDDTWSALGSGLSLEADAITVSGSNAYAGGTFLVAGGSQAYRIAKWDGSAWSAFGTGSSNGTGSTVLAVAISGSDMYVGGSFTTAGGAPANHIAKWDGSSWSALGTGTNSNVQAIAISGSDVYVGGQFIAAGGVTMNRVARWDGSAWHALGTGTSSDVYALAVSGSDLYAAGGFISAGGSPANHIAKWDGSTWSALGAGTGPATGTIKAMAVSGSNIYVGGVFTTAGGAPANRIAKWDGSSWSALGSGLDNSTNAIAVNGNDVYAGGLFTTAGGVTASRVAGWNGSSWFDLAGGVNNPSNTGVVYALAMGSSGLYVGGSFTTAGGVPVSMIALYQTAGLPTVTPGPSLTPTSIPTSTNTPVQTPSASPTRTFTPIPGDNPPTITVPLNYPYRVGVEIGNYLALRFDASDPDVGDIVTFSISGLPSGASFPIPTPGNPIHSTLTWHPTSPDIGTYYVTVTATDSHGSQDSAVVQIDVVPGCVPYFSDVFTADYFYPGVQYLFCHLVISGYVEPDLTFTYRPYNNTTRGQFSKMIAGAYNLPDYDPPTPDFTDVPTSNPFYTYIEAVYHAGIVSGYPDHTFHPFASITRGQLSKLIVGAAGWAIDTTGAPHFSDVPPSQTFYSVIETAYNRGVITGYPCGSTGEPCDPQQRPYFRVSNTALRGQIAKILWIALGSPSLR